MATDAAPHSKLSFDGPRVRVPVADAIALGASILRRSGCDETTACEVATHLVDADLCGVESHGLMRVLQYEEQFASGYLDPRARPVLTTNAAGRAELDGQGGIGIPAMRLALAHAATEAERAGIAVLPVRNVGHTGRIGAFVETVAARGLLAIVIGGGGRTAWRQAAPHGGRQALLPTNPYSIGMPGGERGPVVIDFATSMIAGGWLHSARAAGALVPEGAIIDAEGRPSRDPQAYFDGGAILPKGGPMGYGMALMAELICEAMLGPATTECNWLVLTLDAGAYRDRDAMRAVAEEILAELRACPPAPGFARVEVPGERERAVRDANLPLGIALPAPTLARLRARLEQG
jgi:LDH2 family malate/lactate/ureidoglycolate dehydrogenase